MPTQWETFPIKLGGGLITNMGRLEQGIQFPGSATVLENFEEDVRGGYSRILGYSKFSEEALAGDDPIVGVIPVNLNSVIVRVGLDWRGSIGNTWTIRKTTTAKAQFVIYDRFNFDGTDKIIAVDGVTVPALIDVATQGVVDLPSATEDVTASHSVSVFKGHLFFSKKNILTFTAPYNASDFTPANGAGSINVGDDIVRTIVFRDQLIVFCKNRILRVVGNTSLDFQMSDITTNTGCIAAQSVQEVGGDIMYLANDGVRYLSSSERDNDFGLTRASSKIQNLVTDKIASETNYFSVTIPKKNQYRLFFNNPSTSEDNTHNLIGVKFSDQTSDNISWSSLVGLKVTSINRYSDVSGDLIVFTRGDMYVYVMERGVTFDGRPIRFRYYTPYISFNDPKIRKTLYKHTVYTSLRGRSVLNGSVDFDYGSPNVLQPLPYPIIQGTEVAAYDSGATYDSGFKYSSGVNLAEFYNNLTGSGFVASFQYFGNEEF